MDTFRSENAKRAPKVSRNDRFYKVFYIAFLEAPKRCVPNGFPMFHKLLGAMKNHFLFDLRDLSKDLAQGLDLDLDLGLSLGPSRNHERPGPRSRPGSLPRSGLPNDHIIALLASP